MINQPFSHSTSHIQHILLQMCKMLLCKDLGSGGCFLLVWFVCFRSKTPQRALAAFNFTDFCLFVVMPGSELSGNVPP